METAWIKVFILSLTQCMAPAGKMICQEETVQYQFASEQDCAEAMVQMIELAARADNILINREKTDCRPAVMESMVYDSGDAARSSLGQNVNAEVIRNEPPRSDALQSAHTTRLQSMKTCEATRGAAPCRIGDIIVEAAAESPRSDVWRQQK